MDGTESGGAKGKGPNQFERVGSPARHDGRSARTAAGIRASRMKTTPPNGGGPPGRIGYVLKMFPRLSETFILNEILELERQGLALQIFSLKRPADSVTHAQSRLVQSP